MSAVHENLRIFTLAPAAVSLYTFGKKFEESDGSVSEELFQDSTFQCHAVTVVGMLYSIVAMMAGDDVSPLGDTLQTLGAKHFATVYIQRIIRLLKRPF